MYTKTSIPQQQDSALDLLVSHSYPLKSSEDLDHFIEEAGKNRIVMLGEASHGTHEYYKWRTLISQRLIKEKGFRFIAVEGDWPDCYRVNRYVKNYSAAGKNAYEVLHAFNRWPTWMWANWETVALAESLYNHNKTLPFNKKVGFYGLDVYSLWESMEAIIEYLQKTDPSALSYAREAFQCFEPYKGDEGTNYAYASALVPELCTREVVNLLTEIQRRAPQYNSDLENVFSAEQNALVTHNAEKYYRAMIHGGNQTWNIRDTHMMQTLSRLLDYYGRDSRAIVWAHNTHVGDARATDMRFESMHNIGELARKEYAGDVFLAGFGSYQGSVIAASGWGQKAQEMNMPPAIAGSWEELLQKSHLQNAYFLMDDFRQNEFFQIDMGHRAIGVVYDPESEKRGNYVPSRIAERYDAFLFLEETKALHSLHVQPNGHQIPETYPFGT